MIAQKYLISAADFKRDHLQTRRPDRRFSLASLQVKVYYSKHLQSRCAVIAPLDRFSHVVARNVVRRMIYEAVRPYIATQTPPLDMVCIIGKPLGVYTPSQLQSFFTDVFHSLS